MVHSKLITEGKVVPLTFQQLKKLERMDAKKEREAKLLSIAEKIPAAAGYIIGQGFRALGTSMNGFLSGDAIAFTAKAFAGTLFLSWLVANYPNFARATHLDHLAFGSGASPPPPGVPPPGSTGPGGQWCVSVRYVGAYGPVDVPEMCFSSQAERDKTADYYSNHTAGNFIIVSEKG